MSNTVHHHEKQITFGNVCIALQVGVITKGTNGPCAGIITQAVQGLQCVIQRISVSETIREGGKGRRLLQPVGSCRVPAVLRECSPSTASGSTYYACAVWHNKSLLSWPSNPVCFMLHFMCFFFSVNFLLYLRNVINWPLGIKRSLRAALKQKNRLAPPGAIREHIL